ncbi:ketopantoate reductase PanE/ApbA C terminal-domain-containing protein [Mycena amicta]|nr:ketopantoate reductase PanE/ApbA C terminal-domain-containing protein [Mycena amicta]
MRVFFAGAGSLGSIIAHNLRRATGSSHSVILLHRNEVAAPSNSFIVQTQNATTTCVGLENDVYEPPTPTAIDSLIVTTRPFNTVSVIQRLVPRLSPESTIVLVQNGLVVYEKLVQTVFTDPKSRPHFVLATTNHAGFFEPGRTPILHHSTVGTIDFGIVSDPHGRDFEASLFNTAVPIHQRALRLSDVAELQGDPELRRYRSLRNTIAALLLAQSLNPCWRPLADIEVAIRRTLVINSIIHPLTTLLACPTRQLFQQPRRPCSKVQAREEAKSWITEGDEVGGIMGIARIPQILEENRLLEECLRVANSSELESPMLTAVRHNRPTEIEYLNGYLLRLGKTFGVQMPTTAAMCDLVRMRTAIPLDQIS